MASGADAGRVRALFDEAMDLPPAERSAFLDRACGGDRALRAEVEQLVAAEERAERFLEAPAARVTGGGPAPPEAAPPSAVGPYRIVEPLGRGGMGVVYRARHERSGATVALKTVAVADPTLLASIRREIHALARIHHPGIARIVDEGVASGLPWYAMELYEGQTLRTYARARIADADPQLLEGSSPFLPAHATPSGASDWWTRALPASAATAARDASAAAMRPPRSTDARPPAGGGALPFFLALVRRLCAPLAYLHGEGIVHRDLKPDNILVRPDGSPVLLDLGLVAQFQGEVSREALDQTGDALGTAAYMAPEQGRGELVDARADLFALGCVLYELLTGRTPFPGNTALEVLERRYHEDARPPSELVDGVAPELEALVMGLFQRDPRRRIGHADTVAAALARLGAEDGGAAAPPARAYLYRPGLSGRDGPLRRLERQVEALGRGQGGITLIGGESGVGKTRMAIAVGSHARAQGMRVLAGECLPLEPGVSGGRAFGALHALRRVLQGIADHCRARGEAEARRVFGSRGALLSLYEPALRTLPGLPATPPPAELPPEAARLRLLGFLVATLRAVAHERPLVVLLDDLQWADELTLDLLRFLARTSGPSGSSTPILVLGTYRTEEVSLPLQDLASAEGIVPLVLGRLDEPSVGDMASDMLAIRPAGGFVRLLHQQTEGNPFFVAEYLRAAVQDGLLYRDQAGGWVVPWDAATPAQALPLPGSVRDLVVRRLEILSDGARELLECACVLGRESEEEVLHAAALVPEAAAMEALTELQARQILEEPRPGLWRFSHDRIREIGYQRISDLARAARHRRAAEVIEGRPGHDERLAELGMHWERGGEPARARTCYLAAGRRASDRYAHAEAERLYRSYLALVTAPSAESAQARHELGDLLRPRGRVAEAFEEFRASLDEARALHEPAIECASLRMLGLLHRHAGRALEARRCFEEALRAAVSAGDRPAEGRVLGNLANWFRSQGQVDEAHALQEQALSIMRETGDRRGEGIVLINLGNLHLQQGRLPEARTAYDQALHIHRSLGARAIVGTTLGNLANVCQLEGQTEAALALYQEALAIHREVGDRQLEGFVLEHLGSLRHMQGATGEARVLMLEAIAIAREAGDRVMEGVATANLGLVHLDEDDVASAQGYFEQALAIHREVGDRTSEGVALVNQGSIALDLGQVERARTLFQQGLRIHRETGDQRWTGASMVGLARVERWSGRLSSAAYLVREARRLLPGGDKVHLAICLVEAGHVALAEGRDARPLMEEARAITRELGIKPGVVLARALAALESALAAHDAGEPLVHGQRAQDYPSGVIAST